MKIVIDADACPRQVLETCKRIGEKYNIQVYTVASYNHNIESDNHIVVDSSSQAADIKIINISDKNDIVITQDWGLAAILLSKGVRCINPSGRAYNDNTIGFMLEEREAKAKYRRSGGRTKGPSKRTINDNTRFENEIDKILKKTHKDTD